MKTVILISLIGTIVGVVSPAHPAPLEDKAWMQGRTGRYSLGIQSDSVLGRDMTFDEGSASRIEFLVNTPKPFPEAGERIADVELKSRRVMLSGTMGLMSWLDFFLKLGIADPELSYRINRPSLSDQIIKYDGSVGVAYGAGLKAHVANWGPWVVISDLHFLRYEVEGDYTVDGQDLATLFAADLNATGSSSDAVVQEFHLTISLTRKVGMMTPYGGINFSDVNIDIDSRVTGTGVISLAPATELRREKHESADHVGVFLGTGLEINDPWTANIEIRIVDETAVSIGIHRHF